MPTEANAINSSSAGLVQNTGTSFSSQTFVPLTSWTPIITIGGSSTGITYNKQAATYMQIGSVVFYNIEIVLTSIGGLTGNVLVTNFPVNTGGNGTQYNTILINMQNITLSSSYTTVFGEMATSTNSMSLNMQGSALGATNLTGSQLANNSIMCFNGWYGTN